MAITWDNVLAIAPECSAVPDNAPNAQAQILAEVALEVSPTKWGALFDTACTYLAAHLGSLTLRQGKGMVTQERVDILSRSYAQPTIISDSLDETPYGRRYKSLRRTMSFRAGKALV